MALVTRALSSTVVLLLTAVTVTCSTGSTSTETMPTDADSARQLAQTVAANGGCGSFEDYNFDRAPATWVFTCQKPGMSFEIVAYASAEAKSAEIKALNERSVAYLDRKSYTVAVVRSDGGSPDSALAGFK